VGGYVLGNFLTSVIAGFGHWLDEEYLLVRRIMGRNVRMPAVVSVAHRQLAVLRLAGTSSVVKAVHQRAVRFLAIMQSACSAAS
jgi:hypothetical protein